MTYEELLAEVNKLWDVDGTYELYKALRAVVESHKPFDADVPRCLRCIDATTENGKYEMMPSPYPCETIRTIEKELN